MQKLVKWRIANALGFQAIWFACIFGQTQWLVIPLLLLAVHFVCVPDKRNEIKIVGLTVFLGVISDSLLTYVGLFEFNGQQILAGFIPVWLIVLWAGLGATLLHSFSAVFHRPVLMPLIFSTLAPVSYFAGERLGAVSIEWPLIPSYLTMAGVWLVVSLSLRILYQKVRH
ncbi:DUF2878 domain-containing protein [Alteromonas oceanisediminis]|uniref:DUF2878 domain-containing protein n=1 Tax=Alteromonas oceanisediminis TaxID=2836180 RepID=UPI001BDB37AA|nr:DUF2878 domain-containing protein [Alteromonas oceanisediminis]MBT0586685.1 DUF2878 family protein [Alteromonas oceanisediminis]